MNRRSAGRLAAKVLTSWLILAHAGVASAQAAAPGAGVPSAEDVAARAAEAKQLNKEGIAMLDAGDLQRALEYFARSRKVLATTKNTTNTAIVLDRLGRYDEALELYEELLLKFAGGLDDEDRAAITPAMAALREKVGSVEVSSTVGGDVFIDGRPRGKLPFVTPLRVLAGQHRLRVTRAGFSPFETTFEVGAGKSTSVDAKPERLKGVGQMLVEDIDGAKATVFVDGVDLGTTPWEGSLAPGNHLVWTRRDGDKGSMPTWVEVVDQQAALARLQSRPLGGPIVVHTEPRTALIEIDGVSLGPGRWEGRLPAGSHALTVAEAGYFTAKKPLATSAGAATLDVAVKLEVDLDHPRWPKPTGAFLVELFGGPLLGPTLNGIPDAKCPDACDASSLATGFELGARGGYRFPVGIAVEFSGGYLALGQSIERRERATFRPPVGTDAAEPAEDAIVTYSLADEAKVDGPLFSIGTSYRKGLGNFFVGGRASFGVLVATSRDVVSGTAATTGDSVPVRVQDPYDSEVSAAPMLSPELVGGLRVDRFDFGLSLGVKFFPARGPKLDRGRVGPDADGAATDPTSVQAAPETDIIGSERAFGPFWVFAPALTAATSF